MEEKVIIKSKKYNVKKLGIILVLVGVLLLAAYAALDTIRYTEEFNEIAAKNYDWFDYSSPLEMAFRRDGGFLAALLLPVVFAIAAVVINCAYSKVELTVTDKRVFGCATFGKRVDLPLDSITAVGTSALKGIDVTTASGAIKFKYVLNRDEIHSEISKLLMERQGKTRTVETAAAPTATATSNADELKKYKELLDMGAVTQEEFDAKKKQLLGL